MCGRGRRRPAGPTDVPSLDREFAVSLFWVAAAVTVGGSGSAGEAGAFGGRAFRGQPHRDFRGLVVLMKPVTKKPVAAQRRAGRPPPAGLVHLLRKGVAQLLACPRGHGMDRRPGHSASGCRAPPSQWGSPGIPPLDRLGAGEGKPAYVVWACACAPPAAGLLGGHPTAGVGVHARRVKEVPGASWGCRQVRCTPRGLPVALRFALGAVGPTWQEPLEALPPTPAAVFSVRTPWCCPRLPGSGRWSSEDPSSVVLCRPCCAPGAQSILCGTGLTFFLGSRAARSQGWAAAASCGAGGLW